MMFKFIYYGIQSYFVNQMLLISQSENTNKSSLPWMINLYFGNLIELKPLLFSAQQDKLIQLFKNIQASLLSYTSNHKQILLPLYNFQMKFNFQRFQYESVPIKQLELNSFSVDLVLRILEIALICLKNFQSNTVITKRNLYYQLNKYYKDYAVIDSDLKILCQSLCLKRKDLKVIASSRCLIYGKFTLLVNGEIHKSIQSPSQLITVPTCSELLISQSAHKKILLIQKQSIFYSLCMLLKEKNNDKYLLMTAKGYPDVMTRQLLYHIKQSFEQIYYLGDYDVYGFDIFCFYAFGDWSCPGLIDKIVLLELIKQGEDLFHLGQLQEEFEQFSAADLRKIESIRSKDYFMFDYWQSQSQQGVQIINRIRKYRNYFDQFIKKNKKAELQSFDKHAKDPNWIHHLILKHQRFSL